MTRTPVTDAADLTESAVEWVRDIHSLVGDRREEAVESAKRLCEAAQEILAQLPPAAYAETLARHKELSRPLSSGLDGSERFLWRALQELIPGRHMLAIRAERENQPKRHRA